MQVFIFIQLIVNKVYIDLDYLDVKVVNPDPTTRVPYFNTSRGSCEQNVVYILSRLSLSQ